MTKFILGTKQSMTQFFNEEGRSFPATLLFAGPTVVTQIKTKEQNGYCAVQVAFGERKEKNINKAQKGHFAAAVAGTGVVAEEMAVAEKIEKKIADTDTDTKEKENETNKATDTTRQGPSSVAPTSQGPSSVAQDEKVGRSNFAFAREFRLAENDENITKLKVGDTMDLSSFAIGDKVRVTGTSKAKGFQGVVKRHGFHGGPRSHGQKHSEREPGSIGATGPQRVFKGTRMGGRMGGDRVCVKNLTILGVDVENNQLLVSGAVPGRRGTLVEIVG